MITTTILMGYQIETTTAPVAWSRCRPVKNLSIVRPTKQSLPALLLELFFLLASSRALYYCISISPRSGPWPLKPTLTARSKFTPCRSLVAEAIVKAAAAALIQEAVARVTMELLLKVPSLNLNPTNTRHRSALGLSRRCLLLCPPLSHPNLPISSSMSRISIRDLKTFTPWRKRTLRYSHLVLKDITIQ